MITASEQIPRSNLVRVFFLYPDFRIKVVDEPATESRTGRTAQWYTKRFKKFWVPTKSVQKRRITKAWSTA